MVPLFMNQLSGELRDQSCIPLLSAKFGIRSLSAWKVIVNKASMLCLFTIVGRIQALVSCPDN